MKNIFRVAILLLLLSTAKAQSSKTGAYFGDPIFTDSATTLIIPTQYNAGLFTSNKLLTWGNYYANIIFYNFKTDQSKKLFDKDTYIMGFNSYNYNRFTEKQPNNNFTPQWVFYKVKNIDHNKNGKVDNNDPNMLYVSDIYGNNLRCITTDNESVESINLYEKQQFALIKFQRDADKDGDFEYDDYDYYYLKLDLNTLTFGNKIEIK